jgi:predicted dehydrogenase
MSDGKVRLGVVGVGGMGSQHCKICSEGLEEVVLAAVADIDAARAKEVGQQYGVASFTSHRDLIGAGIVDAVLIATPHYFHPPIAVDAFEAGLHVLSEKPIGVETGNAERMLVAARESGKVFGVMFQMRAEAPVRRAKELVAGGELGEIRRTLLVSPEFRSQAYYDSGTWRATWAGEGGGVLMNQAPHIMDVFVTLGGMPKRVLGRCAVLLHRIEVEDHAEALLEYAGGGCGYFYVSTCERGPRTVEIVGDRGKLALQGGTLRFWRHEPGVAEFNRTNTEMWGMPKAEEVEFELPECETGHKAITRNFARAILHGEPLLSPGADGLMSLELANAITLSSQKGAAVDLPVDREEFHEVMEGLRATSSFKDEWGETQAETDPQHKT